MLLQILLGCLFDQDDSRILFCKSSVVRSDSYAAQPYSLMQVHNMKLEAS